MGNIKSDWRSGLKEDTLEALARITVEGPSLKEWANTRLQQAINTWYQSKMRRIEQSKRKFYVKSNVAKKSLFFQTRVALCVAEKESDDNNSSAGVVNVFCDNGD